MSKSRSRSWLYVAACGISFCLMLGCFGIVEAWLRHDQRYASYYEKNGIPDPDHTRERLADAYLKVHPKNVHEFLRKTEFIYERFSNSEGLTGSEIPASKTPGEFRIIALGDSFTEGVGTTADRSYPAVLGRILRSRPGSVTYTVINAGVSGSDPVFYIELLRRRLLKYRPDLVLTTINSSDLDDLQRRGGFDRFAPDGQLKEPGLPWWTCLFDRSHLVRLFILGVLHYDWQLYSPAEIKASKQKAIRELVQSGIVSNQLAAENGFKLLIIVHPIWWEVRNRTMPPELVEVEEELRAAGVDYADLLPDFLAEIPGSITLDYYWPRDSHFTAKGYEVFARAVNAAIHKREYVH